MFTKPFAELSVFDKVATAAFYLAIVLIALLLVLRLLVSKLKKDALPDYSKLAKGFVLGFAVSLIAVMLTLKFDEMINEGSFIPILVYPISAIVVAVALSAVAGSIVNLVAPDKIKLFRLIAIGVCAVPFVVSVVYLSIYYRDQIAPSGYYTDVSTVGLVVSVLILCGAALACVLLFGKNKNNSTRSVTYAAVCIALSFALSYIRVFKLPQGGSVTFASLLPLILYSYMFGIKKGVVAGVIYGILQAVQDPWIIHPAQFILDYPIAFGMIGLAGVFKEIGLFKKQPVIDFVLGGIFAVLLRYLAHALSGIFAFASYAAAANFSAVAWGFLYNCFALVDMAVALAVGCLMFASKTFVRQMEAQALK